LDDNCGQATALNTVLHNIFSFPKYRQFAVPEIAAKADILSQKVIPKPILAFAQAKGKAFLSRKYKQSRMHKGKEKNLVVFYTNTIVFLRWMC
jgi:hypothetical protein